MANEVDNRVVQLEMDNGSFEKGANQSIKTLDKLDKALEFKNGKRSFSEVEEAAAKCDFKTLLTAGDAVVAKFSAIGIAGITAIQNITNRAVDAGIKIAKSLSIDQITTGFSKYEQKTANVQTLINSTGKSIDEVNEYLDRLMWFSDETSYGFTDMTQALSTMVSAGGDIDKLVPMIEGMANATAFAGKGAAEFNRVIYNLNQSYSQGFLSYMDWKSVQMAGASSKQLVDQLIRAGEEVGTIKKGQVTIDNFTSTLSKKWANREVMEKAFGYFDEMTQKAYEMIGTVDESGNTIDNASQAYEILSRQYDGVSINAAKAAQEAKSFTEAIDSTKDAVSSGWMRTFEIIIGNYEQAKTLWTDVANGLWDIFAGGFEERNNLLQEVFQTNPVEDYAKSLEKAGIKYDDFKAKAKAAYRETTNASDRMSDKDFEAMTAGATSFNDLLKQSWMNSSILEKTLGNFGPNISDASNGTKKFSGSIKDLLKEVNSGKYGYGIKEQQKNLIAAGFDGSALGDRWLNKMYNAVGSGDKEAIESINEMMFAIDDTSLSIEEQVKLYDELKSGAKDFDNSYYAQNSGRTIALDGMKNALSAIGDRLGAIGKAWDKVFPKKTADQIKQYVIAFHQFTESLKMGAHQGVVIEEVATRVFTTLSKVLSVIGGIGRVGVSAIKLLGRFTNWVLNLKSVQNVLNRIKEFFGFVEGNVNVGLDTFAQTLANIANYLDSLSNADFDKLPDKVKKLAKYFAPLIRAWNKLKAVSAPVIASLTSFFTSVGTWLYTNLIIPFANFIYDVINSENPIETLIAGFKSFGKNAYESIKKLWDLIRTGNIGAIFDGISKAFPGLKGIIDSISEAFEKLTTNADGTKKSLDFSKVISVLTFAGLFTALAKLAEGLNSLKKAADAITTTFSSIKGLIARKFGNSFANNIKAITTAIATLTVALVVLTRIDQGKLWSAAGVIFVLLTIMAGLSIYMGIVSKKFSVQDFNQMNGFVKPMLGMAVSLLLIASAIKKIIPVFDGIEGFGATITRVIGILALIGGLGLELIGFTALMSMMKGKVEVSALIMIAIAAAVWLMASAVNSIKDIQLSPDAVLIILSVLAAVVIVAIAMTKISSSALSSSSKLSPFTNAIIALAALAVGLYFGLKAIEKLKELSMEDILSQLIKAIPIFAVVVIVAVVLNRVGKKLQSLSRTLAEFGIAILAMIGAVYLLVLLVGKLNEMQMAGGDIMNAALVLAGIMFVLAAFAAMINYAMSLSKDPGKGLVKLAASLIVSVIAIAGLVGVLKMIDLAFGTAGKLHILKIGAILAGIVFLVGGLAVLIGLGGKLGNGKGVGVLIAALAGVVALAAVLVVLTSFSWEQMAPGFWAILGVMVVLGVMMMAIGFAARLATKNTNGGAAALFGMAVIMISIGAALALVATQPWQGIAAAVLAIIIVMGAIWLLLKGISKIKFSLDTLWNVLAGIAVLAAIVIAIRLLVPAMEALAELDSGAMLKNVGIMLLAVLGMAVIVGILAGIAAVIPGMVVALLAAALVLVAIGVLFVAFAFSMAVLANINYSAIASGLAICAGPMLALGEAGVILILGAVGIALCAAAIFLLGLAGTYSANGIVALSIAIEYLLGILSAVGNAFQNSNGNIFAALANLRTEMENSATSVAGNADVMKKSLLNIVGGDIFDGEGFAENIGNAYGDVSSVIEEHGGEVTDATVGNITSAGDAATEEATKQGERTAEAYNNGYQSKLAQIQKLGTNGDKLDQFNYSRNAAESAITPGMSGIPSNIPASYVSAPKQQSGTKNTSILDGLISGGDVNSFISNFTSQLGSADMSGAGSLLGGNLMDSLSTYIGGQGTTDFIAKFQDTFAEGDFSAVTDNITTIFGSDLTTSFGSVENTDAVKNAAKDLMENGVDSAKKVDANPAGKSFCSGIVQGINDSASTVIEAARKLGEQAKQAFDDAFGNAANGLSEDGGYRTESEDDYGNEGFSEDPVTIRPVLDMTDIYSTLDDFDSIYTPTVRPTLDMSGADPGYSNVAAVAAYDSRNVDGYETETRTSVATVAPISFTQNNYSPKNLSRVDIYRQTRNQLDAYEEIRRKR
nr:MAG TPA: tail tape measure [Caudoviricetes sp.]